ncbi:tetratricopeptide repeat protein [Streptomyces formicae]|uniref:Tetratricopeptide repeat protein n=1 Tax=Streptomyces formicae TaxID=1616117 RepID=A0ABY3WST2_9ACTN|nr:tetratricopeptide repeat protein [Streptomyces formicae]UNM15703.1 hypothetical protein J4032_33390 [Streptomyces formicae]
MDLRLLQFCVNSCKDQGQRFLLLNYGEAKSLLREAIQLVEQGLVMEGGGSPDAAIALHHQALLQHQLLSPITEPSYDWQEMDIRSRLGRAYVATGRISEARRQFQAVLDVHRARADRAERAERAAATQVLTDGGAR